MKALRDARKLARREEKIARNAKRSVGHWRERREAGAKGTKGLDESSVRADRRRVIRVGTQVYRVFLCSWFITAFVTLILFFLFNQSPSHLDVTSLHLFFYRYICIRLKAFFKTYSSFLPSYYCVSCFL